MSLGTHNPIRKRRAIEEACRSHDIDALVQLANDEGGLLDDDLRITAWPLLLGCSETELENEAGETSALPKHQDEEQVQKDVDRAFIYYPSFGTTGSLEKNKQALFNVIVKVLRHNPMLHYFQGYHDIVQVFYLVLGEKASYSPVVSMSLLRIRDYMLSSMDPSLEHLRLILPILQRADPELAIHLSTMSPVFALSAVLTLYAHEMQKYGDIARLYDFLLAHEPVYAIYLFAVLIISRRSELLEIPAEDQDMLLLALSKLPQSLDLQTLIDDALAIFKDWPPEQLPGQAWRQISTFSVLKTSRTNLQNQNLDTARGLFKKQSQQVARKQMVANAVKRLRQNQARIVLLGTTLLVGILSFYLRKEGSYRLLQSTFWRVVEAFKKYDAQ